MMPKKLFRLLTVLLILVVLSIVGVYLGLRASEGDIISGWRVAQGNSLALIDGDGLVEVNQQGETVREIVRGSIVHYVLSPDHKFIAYTKAEERESTPYPLLSLYLSKSTGEGSQRLLTSYSEQMTFAFNGPTDWLAVTTPTELLVINLTTMSQTTLLTYPLPTGASDLFYLPEPSWRNDYQILLKLRDPDYATNQQTKTYLVDVNSKQKTLLGEGIDTAL